MKYPLHVVLFALLAFAESLPAADEATFVGPYRGGPMDRSFLELRDDGTFNYRISGHVGPSDKTEGLWEIVGENLIRLESYEKQPESEVQAEFTGRSGPARFSAEVSSEPAPGVEIRVTCAAGHNEKAVTDINGQAKIDECDVVSLVAILSNWNLALWERSERPANLFRIEIVPHILTLDGELYYLHDDVLFPLEFGLARGER